MDGWELLLDLRAKILAMLSDLHEVDLVAADSLGNRVVELSQLSILNHCTDPQVLLPYQLQQRTEGGEACLAHPFMRMC